MKALVVTGFIVGVIPFAAGAAYYLIDFRRTGQLYRRKFPWMVIMAIGGAIAVASIAVGIASSRGGALM